MMEDNEQNFCSLWTEKLTLDYKVDLLINKKLDGDYFFNRLNYRSEKVEGSTIDKAVGIFSRHNLDCFVYTMDENSRLQDLLLSKGFSHLDTMHVLKPAKGGARRSGNNTKYLKSIEAEIWIDIFCESFDIVNLKHEVQQILLPNLEKLELFLCLSENNYVGCGALYNDSGLTGIYCLGTIPSMREKGVATGLLNYLVEKCEQENRVVFLQTLESDNFVDFYNKLGFTIQYSKKIYYLRSPKRY